MKKPSQNIKKLNNRKQKFTYVGSLEEFQLYGSNFKGKAYSRYERDPYNKYQNFLYKRAMFGLKMYTPEEIKDMHWQKKKRIKKVHKRTQNILNIWKQQIVIAKTNTLFQFMFPKSILAQKLIELGSETDSEYKNNLSFKELKISKEDIVFKLQGEGILPHDFLKLKGDESKEKVL